jgi:peptidoglycan/LPS O-acetylase OafA/YrhL
MGFTSFALQMRFDTVTILLLLPLVFGLFLRSKNNKHANSILILVVGVLISAPLLTGITDQTNQPYRFMPLVVFFATGIGMLFSRTR